MVWGWCYNLGSFKAPGISLNRSVIPPPSPHPLSPTFSLYLFHCGSRPRPVDMIHSLAPTPLENSLIIYLLSLSWEIPSQDDSVVGQMASLLHWVWYLRCPPHFICIILGLMTRFLTTFLLLSIFPSPSLHPFTLPH